MSSFTKKNNNQGKNEKINHIVNSLEEYMFTDENIKKMHDLNFNKRETQTDHKNKNNHKNDKSKETTHLHLETKKNTKTELFMQHKKINYFGVFILYYMDLVIMNFIIPIIL